MWPCKAMQLRFEEVPPTACSQRQRVAAKCSLLSCGNLPQPQRLPEMLYAVRNASASISRARVAFLQWSSRVGMSQGPYNIQHYKRNALVFPYHGLSLLHKDRCCRKQRASKPKQNVPCLISKQHTSVMPQLLATERAVRLLATAFTSAPASIMYFAAPTCPLFATNIRAVQLSHPDASTSAPRSTRDLIVEKQHSCAAIVNGVCPCLLGRLTLAPLLIRMFAILV